MSLSSSLTKADLEMFARFGIGADVLDAAAVCRVTDHEAREDYGIRFAPDSDLSGLVFPYLHPLTGLRVSARLRRDNPELDAAGKPIAKYLCPYGDNRHLYFPPGARELLRDTTVPAVFVEAEKSVLAVMAWAARKGIRVLAVGTGGCWGWRGKIGVEIGAGGEREEVRGALSDLDLIGWRDESQDHNSI